MRLQKIDSTNVAPIWICQAAGNNGSTYWRRYFKQFEEKQLPSDDGLLKQKIDRTICNDMCTYQDQCDKHKCDDKIICVDNEWRDVTSQVLYNIAKRKEVREDYE